MGFFQSLGRISFLSRNVVIFLFFLTLPAIIFPAQIAGETHRGIAWQVRGTWQVEGKGAPILTGDAIQPGSLLQPAEGTANHSITVLLPDGQRILYECFAAEDCARGFRVPALYRTPGPFAVEMLTRIQAVLSSGKNDSSTGSNSRHSPRLPRDEEVAVLGPGDRIHVEGLVERLSNGRYTYDLRPLDHAYPRQSHLLLEKKAPSIDLSLPSSGLYVLTFADELNAPRIDLFIAAVRPAQAARIGKSFRDAKELMEQWNEDYQGWPVHDFQRAYLESITLGMNAQIADRQANAAGKIASKAGLPVGLGERAENRIGVAAEPAFSPRPGVFDGDTAVTLRCSTPGATMHFTVDGSQPVASSPVYQAPIMVKGTELTIKSFASVAGRKDSAVVTGIFRIK
jgi:hypothetical protein